MVSVLNRKSLREVRGTGTLLVAIASVIAVGVMCFVYMHAAYHNLNEAKWRYYAQCRMADFWVNLAAHHLSARVEDRVIIRKFNKIYYDFELFEKMSWLGVPSMQNPCDNWIMQEIITEVKPDFIIETGTGWGGTTLFYATVLSQVNEGSVRPKWPPAAVKR